MENIEKYQEAVKHLKDVYGLEPNDLDLKETDTVADVERMAKKYGLKPIGEMTLEGAIRVFRSFKRG